LLDCLDRDETQGVIGHLLAEIANDAFHGPDLEPPRSVSGLLAPHPVRSRAIHCFCHSCACRLADATAVQLTRNPTGLASALRIWQRLPPRSAASGGLNCIRRSNQRIIQLKPMGANVEWEARRDYADFMEAALASGFFRGAGRFIMCAQRSVRISVATSPHLHQQAVQTPVFSGSTF